MQPGRINLVGGFIILNSALRLQAQAPEDSIAAAPLEELATTASVEAAAPPPTVEVPVTREAVALPPTPQVATLNPEAGVRPVGDIRGRAFDDVTGWEGGPRWFVSGTVDLGFLYFRPRFSAGYGIPFRYWLGIDANPEFRGEGVGAWFGLRAFHPRVNLRVGGRYMYTFRRSFLTPANAFDHLDIENRSGSASRYLSLEAELTWSLDVGPGRWVGELAGTAVTLVEGGAFVFEERIRVVADPPWIWRAQSGYQVVFGPRDAVQVAVVGEFVGVPKRDSLLVFRAGIRGTIQLFDDLQLRFRFIPPIASRDSLGAVGGDSYQLGVRYRFASR